MTPAQEIARGQKAKLILEDAIYKEAVEKVQQSIFDDFAATEPTKQDELLIHRLRLKALADVTRQLANVMNTGRLAEAQVEQEKSMAERMASRLRAGIRGVF